MCLNTAATREKRWRAGTKETQTKQVEGKCGSLRQQKHKKRPGESNEPKRENDEEEEKM